MTYQIESNIPIPEEKGLNFQEFYNSMENQKYRRHYERLIERAKDRKLEVYSEKHHIIPKCLGGTNELLNLVRLTAEEHYTAHLLLTQTFPNNYKIVYAANFMTIHDKEGRINNKRYGWLKRRVSEAKRSPESLARLKLMSDINAAKGVSEETKLIHSRNAKRPERIEFLKKVSEGNLGRKAKPEHCAKISERQKGKVIPEETREKIRQTALKPENMEISRKNGLKNKDRKHSEETKNEMSRTRKGRRMPPRNPEHTAKITATKIGRRESEETKAKHKTNHALAKENKTGVYSEEGKKKKSEALKEMWIRRRAEKALKELPVEAVNDVSWAGDLP